MEEVWGLFFLLVWEFLIWFYLFFCFVCLFIEFFTKHKTSLKIREGSLEEILPLVNLSVLSAISQV